MGGAAAIERNGRLLVKSHDILMRDPRLVNAKEVEHECDMRTKPVVAMRVGVHAGELDMILHRRFISSGRWRWVGLRGDGGLDFRH